VIFCGIFLLFSISQAAGRDQSFVPCSFFWLLGACNRCPDAVLVGQELGQTWEQVVLSMIVINVCHVVSQSHLSDLRCAAAGCACQAAGLYAPATSGAYRVRKSWPFRCITVNVAPSTLSSNTTCGIRSGQCSVAVQSYFVAKAFGTTRVTMYPCSAFVASAVQLLQSASSSTAGVKYGG
jgi:hypothetical protein